MSPNSPTYQFERTEIGGLNCGLIRPQDTNVDIRSLAVFSHGSGANGDDLVGLASEIIQIMPPDPTHAFLFPEAPLSLESEGIPGGRAWWHLSIQGLITALENGQYELVREQVPEGLEEARHLLTETVQAALDQFGLDESRLLLAGFSQGAMLSMDVACRGLKQAPSQLGLYSACLISEKQWTRCAPKLNQTRILQSHGRLDPVLPMQTGVWLKELLEAQGSKVQFIEFNGVHTIPMEAVEQTAQMLAELSGPTK